MFNLNRGLYAYFFDGKALDAKAIIAAVAVALSAVIIGYLLGSVNSAIIVSKTIYKDDIRRHGSGNAGLTNMLRTFGKGAAGLTLLGDFLKTAIAVFIGGLLGGFGYQIALSYAFPTFFLPLTYLAGLASILGHIFPVFYNFKGGKGVLCTAVMALVLTPFEFLILIAIFIAIVAWTKYVSLGSVIAASLYPILVYGHYRIFGLKEDVFVALITILIPLIIVYCHRENLKRLSAGTERKISFGKKKGSGEDTK